MTPVAWLIEFDELSNENSVRKVSRIVYEAPAGPYIACSKRIETQAELSCLQVELAERALPRGKVAEILTAHGENCLLARVGYYPNIQSLSERVCGTKHWSFGEVFVCAESPNQFIVMKQIAPDSCEMLTVTNSGFLDVFTAYRYDPTELASLLQVGMGQPGGPAEAPGHKQEMTGRAEALGFETVGEMFRHQEWLEFGRLYAEAESRYQQSEDACQRRIAAGAPPSTWVCLPMFSQDDWSLTVVDRTPASYDDRIELISMRFGYKNEAPEHLLACPFPAGISPQDLLQWLDDREPEAEVAKQRE
jgi:hypothetical protein